MMLYENMFISKLLKREWFLRDKTYFIVLSCGITNQLYCRWTVWIINKLNNKWKINTDVLRAGSIDWRVVYIIGHLLLNASVRVCTLKDTHDMRTFMSSFGLWCLVYIFFLYVQENRSNPVLIVTVLRFSPFFRNNTFVTLYNSTVRIWTGRRMHWRFINTHTSFIGALNVFFRFFTLLIGLSLLYIPAWI